jgi:hypothetical protein
MVLVPITLAACIGRMHGACPVVSSDLNGRTYGCECACHPADAVTRAHERILWSAYAELQVCHGADCFCGDN